MLTRQSVTVASRIMLPAYIAHAAFYGTLYVTDPGGRYEVTPGLAFARLLMPMDAWGLILLAVAALIGAALLTNRRPLMIGVLYLYMAVNLMWAAIYFGAPFINAYASWGGCGHNLLAATACVASARSLMKREV